MDTVVGILKAVLFIGLVVLVFVLGAILAFGAAVAAVPALVIAGLIALFWDVGFIDALAWTWSVSTVLALAIVGLVSAEG